MQTSRARADLIGVLITPELARRKSRQPDYAAENRALVALATEMAAHPENILQALVETVVALCRADSAGISTLEPGRADDEGPGLLRWRAVAGALASNIGSTMARDLVPCGTVLDMDTVLLFDRPARHFAALAAAEPEIFENLLVPFHADGRPVGTLWAIAHDPDHQFDLEDTRLLQSLSRFAAAAWQLTHALGSEREAREGLERQMRERTRVLTETNSALRTSDASLQRAISIDTVGVLFFRLDGHITDANAAFVRMSGYTRDELLKTVHWQVLTPSEFREVTACAAGELAARGETAPYEKQLIRKDGSRWWGLFAPTRLSGEGEDSECIEFIIDITDSKRAEEDLRASEERLRMLFDSMSDAFVVTEAILDEAGRAVDYRFVEFNAAFSRHTGLNDPRSHTVRELMPNIDPLWLESHEHVLRTGEPARFEAYTHALNRWLSVSASRLGGAGSRRVAIVFTDITERKRAEALEAGHKRVLELITEDAPLPTVLEALVRTLEAQSNGLLGSVLLLDEDGVHLRLGAAPSLPEAFNQAIDGIAIGPATGSCGTAAYTKKAVYVADIATDPLWRDYRELALPHGLRACWSTPILSSDGAVLGTFAMYYRQVRAASDEDLRLIETVTRTAAIAIERERSERVRQRLVEQHRRLALFATRINVIVDVDEVLRLVTEEARELIAAHQSITSISVGQNGAQAITAFSLSDKYDKYRSYDTKPYGSGIYAEICRINQPIRMTQAELEAHPLWRGFGKNADRHPPMRGWLAVPITGRDGNSLGLVQLSDKYAGEFTENDEDVLVQLANVAAAALESNRLYTALREREQRLHAIYSGTYEYIDLLAPDGTLLDANSASLQFAGNTRGEVLGHSFWETPWFTQTPGAPERLRQAISRAAAGEFIRFELPLRHPSGEVITFDFSLHPIRDEHGEVVLIVPEGRDITERKRTEEALRESETRFRQFAENSADVLWISDAATMRLEYLSPAFERIWGESRDVVMQNHDRWAELLHPEDRERAIQETARVLAGEVFAIEYRIVRPSDGEVRWIFDTGFPIRDDQGNIRRVAGIAQDTTKRKEAEEALKEADRRKDEFLATLAHELRNPLAPISNALEILRAREADRKGVSRIRETIEHQVNHLARLVDDLLEVSRITRGKIELRKERIDLKQIMQRAVETSGPLVDSAGHELKVIYPQRPLYVEADPVRLTQVIANLLNNAVKYTEGKGRIELGAKREGDKAVVRVRDTGIGIAPHLLSRVFDLFAQVDTSSARAQGGLGIGLTLVKHLVELHGGSVEAQSRGIGQGSEFIVRLALATYDPALVGELPSSQVASASGERKILVVDDDSAAADSLAELLTLYGNDVRVARDGNAALASFDSWRPDVMLLDIGMPGMDGYEVARRVRQQARSKEMKLIAITGWGQEKDRELAREAGFDHHLLKPLDLQALRALLA